MLDVVKGFSAWQIGHQVICKASVVGLSLQCLWLRHMRRASLYSIHGSESILYGVCLRKVMRRYMRYSCRQSAIKIAAIRPFEPTLRHQLYPQSPQDAK